MGRKGKKFIDKKVDTIYSFRVGARSQQDPLVADETAPQGVLIENNPQNLNKKEEQKYGVYFDDDYDYLKHIRSTREGINWDDNNLEVYEIRKEDPQRSKKESKSKRLKLPSSAFESFVEEPIGLLNRAAPVSGPCPEFDPDIAAYLDDDFTTENDVEGVENILQMLGDDGELECEWEETEEEDEEIWGIKRFKQDQDDFYHKSEIIEGGDMMNSLMDDLSEECQEIVIKKGDENEDLSDIEETGENDKEGDWSTCEEDEEGEYYSSDFNDSDDDEADERRDKLSTLQKNFFGMDEDDRDETRSHFTEYSMSSSVVKRNKQLNDLDDQFQAMFIREYAEDQIGALDGEEIEGFVAEGSELYNQVMAQTKKQFKKEDNIDQDKQWIVKWIRDQENKIERGDIPNVETEEIEICAQKPEDKWDCESILSTYSNLYNHPKMIKIPSSKIVIDPVTGMPVEQKRKGLTKKSLALLDDGSSNLNNDDLDTRTVASNISVLSIRPNNETPEERRERKGALKELRRMRREEKKLNKLAFKEEKRKQVMINLNKTHCRKVAVV